MNRNNSCSSPVLLPLFPYPASFFENMAELKTGVFQMAEKYHNAIYDKITIDKNLLANVFLAYINFAQEEPNLFRLQFQSNEYNGRPFLEIYNDKDCEFSNKRLYGERKKLYGNRKAVKDMFFDMWLYAHGIASVLAGNQLESNHDEIGLKVRHMAALLEKNI
jgi:hypothetical protein